MKLDKKMKNTDLNFNIHAVTLHFHPTIPFIFSRNYQLKPFNKLDKINIKRIKTTMLLINKETDRKHQMVQNQRTLTKLSYNITLNIKKRNLHSNSYKEIKHKIEMEEDLTEIENKYLIELLDFTRGYMENARPLSEIMLLISFKFNHEIHPESFVEVINDLYDNLFIDENMIIYVDDIGFYNSNGQLKSNYLEIYDVYNKKTQETSISETSSSSDVDNSEVIDDINPWYMPFGSFIIGGFLITLLFGLVVWFKLKFKKVIVEDKQENDQQYNVLELFIFDYNVKIKLLLLLLPSFTIILYIFRYYYYYKLNLLFQSFKRKNVIKLPTNVSKKSLQKLQLFNNVLGLPFSRTKTFLIHNNLILKMSKRYYPGGKKPAEQGFKIITSPKTLPCQGLANKNRQIQTQQQPNTNSNSTSKNNSSVNKLQNQIEYNKTVNKPICNNSHLIQNKTEQNDTPIIETTNNNSVNTLHTLSKLNPRTAYVVDTNTESSFLNKMVGLSKNNIKENKHKNTDTEFTQNKFENYEHAQNINNEQPVKDKPDIPAVFEEPVPDNITVEVPEMITGTLENHNGIYYIIPSPPPIPPSNNPTNALDLPTKKINHAKDYAKISEIKQRLDSSNPVNLQMQKKLNDIDKEIEKKQREIHEKYNANLKEQLIIYDKIKDYPITSNEKIKLFNDITYYLDQYKFCYKNIPENISRDLEEFKKIEKLLENKPYKWKNDFMKLLENEIIKDPRMYEQFIKEKERCELASKLLQEYGLELPDVLFHEMLRRAGVIVNNDAIFGGDDMYDKQTVIEGEGSSLHYTTYQIMSNNPEKYFIQNSLNLTENQLYDIFDNINNGKFFLGILNNNDTNKFIDSGDEIHMNIITEIKHTNGDSIYISLGHLTSNKDSTTVKLTDKQYINKTEKDVEKEQRFRPYKQFILLDKESVKPYDEGTSFIQNNNFESINIQKIISDAIKVNKQLLETNPIRQPHIMTKEKLKEIALELYQKTINDMNKRIDYYNEEMKNKTQKGRKQEDKLRQAQYDNNLNKQKDAFIYRNATKEYKYAFKLKKDLEKEKERTKELERKIMIQKFKNNKTNNDKNNT